LPTLSTNIKVDRGLLSKRDYDKFNATIGSSVPSADKVTIDSIPSGTKYLLSVKKQSLDTTYFKQGRLNSILFTDSTGKVTWLSRKSITGGTSQWKPVTGGINYSGGNVSIGSQIPSKYKLQITGYTATDSLYVGDVIQTAFISTDSMSYKKGNPKTGYVLTAVDNTGKVIWAPAGNNSGWGLTGNDPNLMDTNTTFLGTKTGLGRITSLRLKTNNIQRMIIDDQGRVGINTNNPVKSLTINGGLNIDNEETYAVSGWHKGQKNNLTFGHDTSGEGISSIRALNISQFDLEIFTRWTTRIFIRQTGQVGIGSEIPTHRLHVGKGDNTDFSLKHNVRFEAYGGKGKRALFVDSLGVVRDTTMTPWNGSTGSGWSLTGNTGTGASNFIGTSDKQNFQIRTDNTTRMLIDPLGNFFIGSGLPSTPRASFEQKGAIGQTSAIFGSSTGTGLSIISGPVPGIGFNQYFNGSAKAIATGFSGYIALQSTKGDMIFGTASSALVDAKPVSNTTKMVLTYAGNLGVGILIPLSSLHVNGNIRIDSLKGGATNKMLIMKPNGMVDTTSLSVGSGPWATSGNNIYNTNTAYVGIGTNIPGSSLDIQASSVLNRVNIETKGTATFGPEIRLYYAPTGGSDWRIISNGNVNAAPLGSFSIFQGPTFGDRFLIDNTGKVGIGILTPLSRLHIAGSFRSDSLRSSDGKPRILIARPGGIIDTLNSKQGGVLSSDAAGNISWTVPSNSGWGLNGNSLTPSSILGSLGATDTNSIRFVTQNTLRARIDKNGNMAIGGIPISNARLSIYGNLVTGNLSTPSDIRYKKNVAKIGNALETVNKLTGVSYNWRKNEFPQMNFMEGKDLGLIAQEVEKVLPELVITDDKGFKTVRYTQLIPVLLEAIKEQQKQIEHLKSDVSARDSKVQSSENRILTLESSMKTLNTQMQLLMELVGSKEGAKAQK
ncbi:MAG: tail fiber domain-containing protein, partial [Opitutaceae bacterium]|nr:tail fiber domain-containing protein [Cytophagales bacterium]